MSWRHRVMIMLSTFLALLKGICPSQFDVPHSDGEIWCFLCWSNWKVDMAMTWAAMTLTWHFCHVTQDFTHEIHILWKIAHTVMFIPCVWLPQTFLCVNETSPNEKIFRVTGPLCREFTDHRWIPLTKVSDAELWWFCYLHLKKQLSEQWKRRWFETSSR